MGDLWPEFAEYVETHVGHDREAHSLGGGSKTPFVARMISVAQHGGARSSHPFRKSEYMLAVISVRHESVSDCVEKTLFPAAMGQTVVTGIFRKDRRIGKVGEEFQRGLSREVSSKIVCRNLPPPARKWGPDFALDRGQH